jgi:hypothetical protein
MKQLIKGVVLGLLSAIGVVVIADQVDNMQIVDHGASDVLTAADLNQNIQELTRAINENAAQIQQLNQQSASQVYDFKNYANTYTTKVFDRSTGVAGETCTDFIWEYTRTTLPDGSIKVDRKQTRQDVADTTVPCGDPTTRHYSQTTSEYLLTGMSGLYYDGSANPPVPYTTNYNIPIRNFTSAMRVGDSLGGGTDATDPSGALTSVIETWDLVRHVDSVKVKANINPIPDCLMFVKTRMSAAQTSISVDWYCANYGLVKRVGAGAFELKSATP